MGRVEHTFMTRSRGIRDVQAWLAYSGGLINRNTSKYVR